MDWRKDQAWEREWWENCQNTLCEEIKQLTLAKKMGLQFAGNEKTAYRFDANGAAIIDVGGGPVSLLLKTINAKRRIVIDPCEFPKWVRDRYESCGIELIPMKGEDMIGAVLPRVDECWMYNCLQHVEDPAKVISGALGVCRILRICEPLGTSIFPGHPHSFRAEWFDSNLHGEGRSELVKEMHMNGWMYYGVFKGRQFGREER